MMDNASLIGLSRQTALRRQMDVIANNLANLQTNGFRAEDVVFAEHQSGPAEISAARFGDRKLSYVIDRATLHDFAPGPLESTGNPLDLAIEGDGWFVVETPEGERYTRNGAFQLNAEGGLVTADGHAVQGEAGPIVFDPEETEISIAGDGTISTNLGQQGQLRLAAFGDNDALLAEGASLFSSDAPPLDAEDARIAQGALEGSNVEPIGEIARMIEVQRSYTSLAGMMERSDELRRQAISTLGRVE